MLKQRLKDFLMWNVVTPTVDITNEAIYQGVFDNQCRNLGIPNDFYPLSGAANHGMLYLLTRLLTDDALSEIVEFGSGQSSLLIDRVRPAKGYHLCLESDADWHARIGKRLARCEYLLAPLERRVIESVHVDTYRSPPPRDFDLMLVDGPMGTESYSRFGCVEWVVANRRDSFVVIIDDTNRKGELETVRWLTEHLSRSGRSFKKQHLRGRTVQTIFAVGSLRHVAHYC